MMSFTLDEIHMQMYTICCVPCVYVCLCVCVCMYEGRKLRAVGRQGE